MTVPIARILIIDDTPANLLVLCSVLDSEFELQFATSGPVGIALALKHPPDLILLDIMMPEMDGFEVCRRLKCNPVLKDIPVVFISALSEIESEYQGLTLGAVDYIAKPVNVEIATRRISNLIEREVLRKDVMAQKKLLEESEAFKLAILNSLAEEIVVLDKSGVIQAVNNPWYKFAQDNCLASGTLAQNIDVGSNYLEVCRKGISESSPDATLASGTLRGIEAVLEGTLPCFSMEYPCHSPTQQRWFKMVVAPLQRSLHGGAVISHTDITERKVMQTRLIDSEAHLRAIVKNDPECIKIVNEDGILLQMNPAGLAMIEANTLEQVKGVPILQLIAPEHHQAFWAMHKRVIAGEHMQMEFEVIGLKGTRRWLETHAVPMQDHGQAVHLAVTRDITQRKQMEAQVLQLAFHDPLTSLPNRRLLLDRLSQAMTAGKRNGCYGALMFLDLDNFKVLNDTHGHRVGDLLLLEVSDRLKACVREVDTVSRFGGDEFVVLLHDLGKQRPESTAQAAIVAEKIRFTLQTVYSLSIGHEGGSVSEVEHHCTASIGVTIFFGHEVSEEHILKLADAAMYKAKDAGRNTIRFADIPRTGTP
ncbi:MAG TPA: diguanylate cyclase [Rhodoferax sp.]|nr:diguanylate cyclase [Rhodoferax sp.]